MRSHEEIDKLTQNPETSSEDIKSVFTEHMAAKPKYEFDSDVSNSLENLVQHKNTTPELLQDISNHWIFNTDAAEGSHSPQGDVAYLSNAITKSPNMSADLAKRYVNNTFNSSVHNDDNHQQAFNRALTHKGFSQDDKNEMFAKFVGLDKNSFIDLKGVSPETISDYLADLLNPESPNRIESQQDGTFNRKNNFAVRALGSANHSTESESQAVDYLLNNQSTYTENSLRKLLDKKDLNPEAINAIHNKYSNSGDSLGRGALQHPNVDPALVAGVALNEDSDNRFTAMKSARLPRESFSQIINSIDQVSVQNSPATLRAVLLNPQITSEDINGLMGKIEMPHSQLNIIAASPKAPEGFTDSIIETQHPIDAMRTLRNSPTINQDQIMGFMNNGTISDRDKFDFLDNNPNVTTDTVGELMKKPEFALQLAIGSRSTEEQVMGALESGVIPIKKLWTSHSDVHNKISNFSPAVEAKIAAENAEDHLTRQANFIFTSNKISSELKQSQMEKYKTKFSQESFSSYDIRSIVSSAEHSGDTTLVQKMLESEKMSLQADYSQKIYTKDMLSVPTEHLISKKESGDDYGLDRKARSLLDNPNLGQDDFEKLAQGFPSIDNINRRAFGMSETDSDNMFRRFGSVEDNPKLTTAILNSEKCPPDVWQSGFSKMGKDDVFRALSQTNFSKTLLKNASPEQITSALSYDNGRGATRALSRAQFDIDNPVHKEIVKNIVLNDDIEAYNKQKVTVSFKDRSSPSYKEFANEVIGLNPTHGAAMMASNFIGRISNSEDVSQDLADFYANNMHQDEHFFDNVSSKLGGSYSAKNVASKALRPILSSPDSTPEAIQSILKHNLALPDAVREFVESRPDMLAASIRGLTNNSQMHHDVVSGYLEKGEYTPESSDAIADTYKVNSLLVNYRNDHNSTIFAGHKPAIKAKADQMVAALSSSSNPVEKLSDILKSRNEGRTDLTKGAINFTISSLVASINNSAVLSEEQKNEIFTKSLDKINKYDLADHPTPFFTAISKAAIASNNVEAQLKILQNTKKPSRALENAIVAGFNIMDDDSKSKVIRQFLRSTKDLSIANSKKISSILQNKIIELRNAQAAGEPIAAGDISALHNQAGKLIQKYRESTDEQIKDHALVHLNAALSNVDPEHAMYYKRGMTGVLGDDHYKVKDKVSLVLASPEGVGLDHHHIPNAVINDSTFVENAANNHLQQALYQAAHRLTPKNAELAATRLINSQHKDAYIKSFLSNGVQKNSLSSDAISKLLESAPLGTLSDVMNHAASNLGITRGSQASANVARQTAASGLGKILPHHLGQLRNHINEIVNEKEISPSHASVLGDLHHAFNFHNAITEAVSKSSGAHEEADHALSQALDMHKTVYDDFIKKIKEDPSGVSSNQFHSFADSYMQSVSKMMGNGAVTGWQSFESENNRNISSDNATKALEAIGNLDNLAHAAEERGIDYDDHELKKTQATAYQMWGSRANADIDSWSHAASQSPDVLGGLKNRGSVSSELIKASGFEKHFTDSFRDAEVALEMLNGLQGKIPSDEYTDAFGDISNKMMELYSTNPSEARQTREEIHDFCKNYVQYAGNIQRDDVNKFSRFLSDIVYADNKGGLLQKAGFLTKVAQQGIMGPEWNANVINQQLDSDDSYIKDAAKLLMRTSNLNKEAIASILEKSTYNLISNATSLISNQGIDEDSFMSIYNKVESTDPYQLKGTTFAKKVLANPKIPFEMFSDLARKQSDNFPEKAILPTGEPFNPAFLNPTHGGDLFRSLPIGVHDKLRDTVDETKLVTEMDHSKGLERLNNVLALIPPEGMKWADFKKKHQKESNQPEVKALFQAKQNKPVMPEDVVKGIEAQANPYHVTYTIWDSSLQTHRSGEYPNLVVQLNTSKIMEDKLQENPKTWSFFQYVQAAANGTAGGDVGLHPVTPHIAGWARVDTGGGKDGWIIEEFQSDFGQKLKSELEKYIKQFPDGGNINGTFYTPDELRSSQKQILKTVSTFYEAAMKGVKELAVKQGVENLFMHGLEARAEMSGWGTNEDYPLYGINQYHKFPKSQGFEEVDYSEYPVKSERFLRDIKGRNSTTGKKLGTSATQCWKIPLKKPNT